MPRQPGQTESRRSSLPKEMTRSQSQHVHDYMTIAYHNILLNEWIKHIRVRMTVKQTGRS